MEVVNDDANNGSETKRQLNDRNVVVADFAQLRIYIQLWMVVARAPSIEDKVVRRRYLGVDFDFDFVVGRMVRYLMGK